MCAFIMPHNTAFQFYYRQTPLNHARVLGLVRLLSAHFQGFLLCFKINQMFFFIFTNFLRFFFYLLLILIYIILIFQTVLFIFIIKQIILLLFMTSKETTIILTMAEIYMLRVMAVICENPITAIKVTMNFKVFV